MQKLGSQLHPDDQKHVLAAFTHRFTKQHRPSWAKEPWKDGQPYPVQFASDADWLANTLFLVKTNGRLDMRAQFCESHPTWPDNPELRVAAAA